PKRYRDGKAERKARKESLHIADRPLVVKRITPVVERQLMLVRRKNRSLSTAAEALWDVVRDQGNALMAGREGDPLYQI
ncbi:hypothetical protein QU797_24290, partial [Escherichia coli]|nr:hypothetical protein [Escherichia coli]